MITENLSTLKIHKLTQEQYEREFEAGNIDPTALYLTPDEEIDLSPYATKEELKTKSDSEHTHSYAGSSSVGGPATSAEKLNTNAGSATQPIYFSKGVPVKTTYTLGASVPSGAKFTDTVYTHPTSSGNKHIPSGGSSGQILRWSSDGTATWGDDNNTTYSAATQSAQGLMSADDKKKLDGITSSADSVSFSRSLSSGTKIGTITINGTGTDLYCQTNTDTNTHYTTRIYAGASGTAANAAATSPYIKITDDNTYRNQIRLIGGGATTVTSDASGNITISSTDTNTNTNTTYSLSKSGSTITLTGSDGSKTSVTDSDTNTTYSLGSFGLTATAAELNYCDGVTSNIQTQLNGKASSSHTHDDRYYTESEVDSKLSGKANSSHGNHVPSTQSANNAIFLRNDNTWATVTPANIGAAASSHNHGAGNITSGTLSSDRLPTVPTSKGGTGATDGATGLKNLFAAGRTVLSSNQYGSSLPSSGTAGQLFFLLDE